MSLFDAVILGIVQGLTEFLPVSSSGHLVITETLLGVPAPGIFLEVALHVATLLSVVIVYRRRLIALAAGAARRRPDALRYIALLALATLPATAVGLLFRDAIERAFDTPVVTGIMLFVTGALLWSTRYIDGRPIDSAPRWRLALGMGVAQACAILPGVSRSGATITTGLWGGITGEQAAEFSFLMSIPAIAGAALLQLGAASASIGHVGGVPLLTAFIAGLVSGVVAIRSLVWLLRRQGFHAFAYYVWAVGALFLLFILAGG